YLNSPGGSVTASEKIRRALAQFQMRTLKPLVVSMNGTAASGAYWIGSQAERIFATKSTLTGSIGVFGIAMGAHNLLNRYGAYQDGVATNELAITPIGEEMPTTQQQLISLSVDNTYRKFLELVAQNRGLKVNDYELFAEGQVFLADEAKIVGLVDEIGDLDDAITYAADLAMLDPETMRVKHLVPSNAGNLGNLGLVFGLAHAYLPDEVTYALFKFHETMSMAQAPHKVSMQAITPVQSPLL
ncbi:MAG TPA: S49 family peptidase, partial [Candidatus Anaerobiospirillum stercoravium]|nr:S49 family peptidase [Candidatus Anaerobiospirillum stercoravium]